MTTMLPKNGINTVPVKPNMEKSKISSDPTKDESRSFLSFSRENLSISHSDIEQGFNKTRPRVRIETILSITAIILALFCIGLEVWKIQGIVDNAREIDFLKHEVETMKHKLLEEDLLNDLKAFEEIYAEEGMDDDDSDYDSVYDDDDDEDDDDSKLSIPEYSSDYHSGILSDERDVEKVLADLDKDKKKIEHRERLDQEAEELESLEEEDDEDLYAGSGSSFIKRKRSTDEEKPLGYNPSGVPIYAHSYRGGGRKNSTGTPRLIIYDSLINGGKAGAKSSGEESSLNKPVIPPWDKHPPKKYYAQSRAPTSHVTPPPSYTSRVHNTRQMNTRRSGGWRDEGPQALTVKEGGMTHREFESIRAMQNVPGRKSQPLRRRGVTRRHLRSPRQVFAAHYAADSSLFAAEDEHVGNGKGRHHQGVFKAWRPSNWVNDLGMSRHFTLSGEGQLTVQETGLYLVYAQIHYLDQHDENGFQVLVNDRSILQCMVYSPGQEHKSRSCFSAQVALLQSGDHLVLKDVGIDRYTLFQHDKSFFGLVRLGDTNTRAQRQQSQN